jgi:proline iminopeptidase
MKSIVKWLSMAGGALVGLAGVGFVGSYLAYSGQFVVPATTTDDPSLPGRSIGGYRYHLELHGLPTRPVVIVLHGGPGGDYRSLVPLQPLSDEYQVVFYDQRGSGLSPRIADEQQLGFEQLLSDLHAVVEAVSPHEPVRLIGHSFGAMLAAAYLEQHPEDVSHAVLAEPEFLTSEQATSWAAATRQGQAPVSWPLVHGVWRSLIQSLYVYGPDADAREDFFAQAVLDLELPGDPFADYYCGADRHTVRPPSWRVGARARDALMKLAIPGSEQVSADVISPGVKRFPHKVLLVAGSCNTVMGPAQQRQNMELFANAELAVIEDAGHALFSEQPEASLALLRRYLREDHSAIVASE